MTMFNNMSYLISVYTRGPIVKPLGRWWNTDVFSRLIRWLIHIQIWWWHKITDQQYSTISYFFQIFFIIVFIFTSDQCSRCIKERNGVGYYEDPNDCRGYLQCDLDSDGVVIAHVRRCSDGTLWEQTYGACVPCEMSQCTGSTLPQGVPRCTATSKWFSSTEGSTWGHQYYIKIYTKVSNDTNSCKRRVKWFMYIIQAMCHGIS